MKKYSMGRLGGFTLIELLVVVLIIGILSAVALPQYTKAVKKSRAAGVLPTLRAVLEAGMAYNMANPGTGEVNLDYLDIALPSRTADLKGITCQYSFVVLPASANAQYAALCKGLTTTGQAHSLLGPVWLAQQTFTDVQDKVLAAKDKLLVAGLVLGQAVHSVQTLRQQGVLAWVQGILPNFSGHSIYLPMKAAGSMQPPLPGGGSSSGGSSGGSAPSLILGLTDAQEAFCAGDLCKEYGFSRTSSLSASADLGGIVSGTLYAM